jgi:hypothetical protein
MAEKPPPALERIPFPDKTAPYLERLEQRHRSAGRADLVSILKDGTFAPGDPIPDHLVQGYLLYEIVTVLNDVITSLNIIVADIDKLPFQHQHLNGRPSKRIDLLLRSFLSEFFRGRELLLRMMGVMKDEGLLDRDMKKTIKESMEKHLGPVVDVRHKFAHGDGLLNSVELNSLKAYEELPHLLTVFTKPDGTTPQLGDAVGFVTEDIGKTLRTWGQLFRVLFGTAILILADEIPEDLMEDARVSEET